MAVGELAENLCGARERRRWATCGAPAQAGEETLSLLLLEHLARVACPIMAIVEIC